MGEDNGWDEQKKIKNVRVLLCCLLCFNQFFNSAKLSTDGSVKLTADVYISQCLFEQSIHHDIYFEVRTRRMSCRYILVVNFSFDSENFVSSYVSGSTYHQVMVSESQKTVYCTCRTNIVFFSFLFWRFTSLTGQSVA